ncbi:MAG: c-type cytochrome [Deltaproteobacteria bacterium]|nr:c-type cytochrome [Deltaproteobacteria bacterium]
MLSKSAARAFFLVGTAVCSLAFVGLTVDTFGRIPEQTHSAAITPEVARGKVLWEASNCMGCHTIFGEGAYYAPELTTVYERRGPDFIRAMLRDPEAMYPGQRRMQNYHFDDRQIEDLLAFLKWSGAVDLNGFPPKPTLMPVAVPVPGKDGAVATSIDRPQIFNQMCVACHALGGQGGALGPALDGVGMRRDAKYLHDWLTDPHAVKADARMPKLPLTPGQIDELVAFLSHLKTGGTP